ncbi:DUF4215 domain-containing protein [Sorangium sp. So ce426]|uniref:DUF4215 domain-containing cysteine-rich repeat protein n=1 Tax=Sorangium sp. So ce426 TaxID=3133312 RepID=UPI003F5BBE37
MSGYRMRRGVAAVTLLCAAAGVAGACGGDDDRRSPRPSASSGTAAGGGEDGGGSGAGGDEGGGGGAPGDCGNGVAEVGELCDGSDLRGADCGSLGFDSGELRCSPACRMDTSRCSGVEVCQDGRDNDGNLSVDCDDTACDAACADLCAAPVALPDPALVTGDTTGHAVVESECTLGAPGVAYTFTATTTGFLDVVLTPRADAALVALLRGTCRDGTERACGPVSAGTGIDHRLTVPVRAGDAFTVVVTGTDEGQTGAFNLAVRSRETVCGDGIQDPTEECDNALGQPDDGCTDECRLDATEVEPNGTLATANPHAAPFYAAIDPADDEDIVLVTVPDGPVDLVAETADITGSDCLDRRLDSAIEILDHSGARLVLSENGGTGLCARAVAPGLAAGDYYVRVRAGSGAAVPTFPYRLDVTLVPVVCGDGDRTAGEQCDDGNTAPGDGCSAACRFELGETEPNNTSAQANPYAAPWMAEIAPAGDVDVIAVSVPGPRSTLAVNIDDGDTGACTNGQLDTFVQILGGDGSTVLASDDDAGVGYCSFASVSDLAAGTVYVKIRAADIVPDATFFYRLNVTLL